MGGIRGCGVPAQRAEATLQVLSSQNCTLAFFDTHTLKALPAPGSLEFQALESKLGQPLSLEALRGGVCKVGSGSDFMDETTEYAGVTLATLSKRK